MKSTPIPFPSTGKKIVPLHTPLAAATSAKPNVCSQSYVLSSFWQTACAGVHPGMQKIVVVVR